MGVNADITISESEEKFLRVFFTEWVQIRTIHYLHHHGDLCAFFLEKLDFKVFCLWRPVLHGSLVQSSFAELETPCLIWRCPFLRHKALVKVITYFTFKSITNKIMDHVGNLELAVPERIVLQ